MAHLWSRTEWQTTTATKHFLSGKVLLSNRRSQIFLFHERKDSRHRSTPARRCITANTCALEREARCSSAWAMDLWYGQARRKLKDDIKNEIRFSLLSSYALWHRVYSQAVIDVSMNLLLKYEGYAEVSYYHFRESLRWEKQIPPRHS